MKNKPYKIEQFPKDNIFEVPERYFDELPSKIQDQISAQESTSMVFNTRMQWMGSLTAAMVILFLGTVFYLSPTDDPDLLADVSADEIIEYLEYEDISTLEIAYMIDVDGLIEDETEYMELLEEDLSSEELESMYTEFDYSTEIM